MTWNVCLTLNFTIVTLDDDLYGTQAKDNQVKTLSSRKAEKEGNSDVVICDVVFQKALGVRFH